MAVAAEPGGSRFAPSNSATPCDPTYPNGDSVGAIVPWQPPDDELAAAPNHGPQYRPRRHQGWALSLACSIPQPSAARVRPLRGGNVLCRILHTLGETGSRNHKRLGSIRHLPCHRIAPSRVPGDRQRCHRQRRSEAVMRARQFPLSTPPELAHELAQLAHRSAFCANLWP